jgi:hypothetical protein
VTVQPRTEVRLIEVRAIEVVPLRLIVQPITRSTRQWTTLSTDMCDCPEGGFMLFHAEHGRCDCGVVRAHTHCKECGGVLGLG